MAEAMIGILSEIFAREAGADIGVGRQQFGQSRLEQDVVEGERFAQGSVGFLVSLPLQSPGLRARSPAPSEDSARSAAKRQSRARLDDPVLGWRRSLARLAGES